MVIDSSQQELENHANPISASPDPSEISARPNDGQEKLSKPHSLPLRYFELKPNAQAQFVDMMRHMPQGLVIVFAGKRRRHTDTFPWQGSMGMLVSSFNSVTVNPTPFVSFNVKLPSRTFNEIERTSLFTVMAVSNAKVADAFKGHAEDRQIIFDNIMNGKSPDDASQGLVWWMRCKIERKCSVFVGNHVIVIGKVVHLGRFKGGLDQEALVYSRGTYKLPGVPITPEDDARRMTGLPWSQKLPNRNDRENALGSAVEYNKNALQWNKMIRELMTEE